MTLSRERRRRLAALALDGDLRILEDDPYGLVRYDGDPSPTLFELEEGGRCCTAPPSPRRSRRGFASVTRSCRTSTRESSRTLVASTYISPALVAQATVLEFLPPRVVRAEPRARPRPVARPARRDARGLERELDGRVRWSRPEGGYFLWLELPESLDAGEAARTRDRDRSHVRARGRLRRASEQRPPGVQLRLARRDREGVKRLAKLVAATPPRCSQLRRPTGRPAERAAVARGGAGAAGRASHGYGDGRWGMEPRGQGRRGRPDGSSNPRRLV